MKFSKLLSTLAVLASAAGVIYLAYKFFKKHCVCCCDDDSCEYLDAYTDEFGEDDEYADECGCCCGEEDEDCCCDECAAEETPAEESDAPTEEEDEEEKY